ncbi:MAG TPA: hypothetical protein VHF06_13400 [Pseudonocardiaceae bacterium]|jgi:uncharacterized protein YacL|nr:hypothetical protein [Pseudonocardiaceae bacterium]
MGSIVPQPSAPHSVLVGLVVFAAAVWVGGFVALVVVARAARRTIGAAERVAFFRVLGRGYGAVSGVALLVGLASGALLAAGRPWTGPVIAAVVVAVLLVAGTGVGVAQARRLTRLRRRALTDAALADRVRAAARRAALLRAGIGGLSVALVVLGVVLGG